MSEEIELIDINGCLNPQFSRSMVLIEAATVWLPLIELAFL
jgi:hypothetical protein